VKCCSYIDGHWLEQSSEPVFELTDPADRRRVVSQTLAASPDDVVGAIDAATTAYPAWCRTALSDRLEFMQRVLAKIDDAREDFARAITTETGKTNPEAQKEIAATIDESRTQLEIFERGNTEIAGHRIVREPLGVVLLVTPSNFPLAGVMRKLVPALLAGNSVVVKTSELTPMTSVLLFMALEEARLAPGVANLVLADGATVVPLMISREELKAISLTGSSATGQAIAAAIGERNIRYQAEMGGSNAVVVLADADLDKAVADIAEHGFAYCGQWCTGTSRVIVEQSVYERFVILLEQEVLKIVPGSGLEPTTTMGPLISRAQQHQVENAVNKLIAEGARAVAGGAIPAHDEFANGNYFEPTLLVDIGDYDAFCNTEIFGPVVAVVPASGVEDALEKANAGQYGLSFSIYTSDLEVAEQFVAFVDAGICHVNLPTGMRDNALPVSGRKNSGRGTPECGTYARDFFTNPKAVYGLQTPRDQA
jgi:acyl-CoA reductase-like NAD-dependent aldehyde dehydrogenase